jgi:hypothetical protein
MKAVGIISLIICGLSVIWAGIGAFYTAAEEPYQYRFDGVYAAEGTTLAVKNGELSLVSGMGFSVDQPLRRIIDQTLWGLCFLMSLTSGIFLLRLDQKLKNSK